ncbi:VanZ family protein [Enterococcus faecium]|uniref:VanZ family protein n=1 Tax=Enterococcus faecium TaxID=1352 RepID=UPI00296B08C8|nr:VanZ family protein [Enterococcus faecium]MDW3709252.1 VanZ family protein [Enterococcus faecium]
MIATMAVIFYFSNQTGEVSKEVGSSVAETMNIVKTNDKSDASQTLLLFGLNLRKWAHVWLYGILGLTVYEWMLSTPKAIVLCFGYSIFDELHQHLVPGREAKLMDVLIDVVGFGMVILLADICRRIHKRMTRNGV